MDLVQLPADVWREVMKWVSADTQRKSEKLCEWLLSLETVCHTFREGLTLYPIQWSLVKCYNTYPFNDKPSDRVTKCVLYCAMTRRLLKEQMIGFIKAEKVTYRSPKTNKILGIGESMKKIRTLPKKFTTVKKREHLKQMIKEYDRLNGNVRRMLGYVRSHKK